ncbi:MAG: 50S ribosomal protein L6 [Xanthobacteraceae bacterium]|nr:50S ribosomal protein L6 [Xanthobacteraceae bacterium]MBX3524113.1 50S ribosomal protein L6 [Xanthobacteraceae bacterium]MBX3533300.1 50S ribosomal protein L6 [Xanthobacteraceae bacterium]MBX3548042.1 50S ribosomal protein L6 [Xanthobacteraceae bacterium]MCW5675983.1 50S ribosomal protein L6 [Xanthobacteraceae bacterium]
MSKIGKRPVAIPSGVTATVSGQTVKVKGPKGELSVVLNDNVAPKLDKNQITFEKKGEEKQDQASWGLYRALVNNIVTGVSKGFEKKLEINGVGYRAAVQGKNLNLSLGYSHDVVYKIPDGIAIATPKPTEIVITGIDKQRVGQVASEIRAYRKPEPYKGKGVKYEGEFIFRKEGKKK